MPLKSAFAAQMVDVRMWPAKEYTRVTLEHDQPIKFKYFLVRSPMPYRLVVDIEGFGVLGMALVVVGVLAEEIALVGADSKRLGVANRVEEHVERIAADVAHGSETGLGALNERGSERSRDSVTAAAAGLDVVNLSKYA